MNFIDFRDSSRCVLLKVLGCVCPGTESICMCTQIFPKGTIQAQPSPSAQTAAEEALAHFAFWYRSEETSEWSKVFHFLIELMLFWWLLLIR